LVLGAAGPARGWWTAVARPVTILFMPERALRVVQLNADSLVGDRWRERRQEIVAWLDELDPDVVCLQEIWQDDRHPNTGGWIAEHSVEDWQWEFGGFPPPDPSAVDADPSLRFGSAILSRWPLEAVELMKLPVAHDAPHPPHVTMRPPALPPSMPFDLFHVRTAGIDVYSTHLQPMPAQAAHRIAQVLFIDEAIGRTWDPSASMPPIVCGDFNAEPMSDEIRFLTANAVVDGRSTYFQDAWAVIHDGGGMTWDPANEFAAAANEPPRRIDYVFVGESRPGTGGAGRVLRASLAFDHRRTGVLASDHFGLVVEIAWPTRPPTSQHQS
jgi:endonuclease/exonuclease/phosphatase family metal-dependent hydrolase